MSVGACSVFGSCYWVAHHSTSFRVKLEVSPLIGWNVFSYFLDNGTDSNDSVVATHINITR